MRLLAVAILAAVVAASAAGVTVHRSFRGGYPSAVSEARRNSAEQGAAAGTMVFEVRHGNAVEVELASAASKPLSDKASAPAW